MPTGTASAAILWTSALGAVIQAAIALRWYEPPERDGETPTPIFEALLFLVGFTLTFALLGYAVSAIAGLAPPITRELSLLITPVGLWLARAAGTGRLETATEPVEKYAGAVFGLVLALYPPLLFVL